MDNNACNTDFYLYLGLDIKERIALWLIIPQSLSVRSTKMSKTGIFSSVVTLSAIVVGWQPSLFAESTIWHFLGVPQTAKYLHNATINRRGNHPKLERKPVPKKIADPANLESKSEAVKRAAEIKQAEDEKPQKIKALKYLATMGCGDYPGVAEALMASLEDPTEEVRYEAAKAIQEAAGDVTCHCNPRGCCSENLVKKLAERAFELDDKGCPIEPSERVRAELVTALQKCCRGAAPVVIEPEKGDIIPPDTSPDDSEDKTDVTRGSQEMASQMLPVGFRSTNPRKSFERSAPPVVHRVGGYVNQVGSNGREIIITHGQNWTASLGSEANLYHDFVLGTEHVGTVRIVQAYPGSAVAVPLGQIRYLVAGDRVSLLVIDPTDDMTDSGSNTRSKDETIVITDQGSGGVHIGNKKPQESNSIQLRIPRELPKDTESTRTITRKRPLDPPKGTDPNRVSAKTSLTENRKPIEFNLTSVIATDHSQPSGNPGAPANGSDHSKAESLDLAPQNRPVPKQNRPASEIFFQPLEKNTQSVWRVQKVGKPSSEPSDLVSQTVHSQNQTTLVVLRKLPD